MIYLSDILVFGLVVESKTVDTDFRQLLEIVLRIGYHQMAIQVGFGEVFAEPFDDGRAEGQVGDEVAEYQEKVPVHDIDVEGFCSHI